MNDGDILDQLGNLRLALSASVEGLTADDQAQMLVACSIFIAGFDAMLSMRKES